MSIELYEAALGGSGRTVHAEYSDGSAEPLDIARWLGPLDAADARLLARVESPVLDIGCGPGRLAAALSAMGVDALGVDVAHGAVSLARTRGASALRASVFDPLPREGEWAHALLIDGNVGIGGDPLRLLRRVCDLLRPDGTLHLELGPPGSRNGPVDTRLRSSDGRVGSWFRWAHVASGSLDRLAAETTLRVTSTWEEDGRWFAELRS